MKTSVYKMANPVHDTIKLLVVRRLSGDDQTLKALKLNLIYRMSLSEIEIKTGIPRSLIRGFRQRLKDRIGNELFLRELCRIAMPHIEKINPIFTYEGKIPRCMICGKEIVTSFPQDHILKKHKDLVEKTVMSVVEKIRKG